MLIDEFPWETLMFEVVEGKSEEVLKLGPVKYR